MVQLWVLISWAFVYEKSTCLKGIFYWWSHSFGGVWRESTTIQIFTVEGILSWWRFARTNWTSTFWMVTHFIREFQFAVRHPKLEMSICSISIHWENNNHTVREFLSFHYKLQSINKIFFSEYAHRSFQLSPWNCQSYLDMAKCIVLIDLYILR